MITYIDKILPAGNIRVMSINGNSSVLRNESRGTVREHWFYWKFRCGFDSPGTYVFRFEDGAYIGPRGACVSTDHGRTWHWNGAENTDFSTESFTFSCDCPMDDVQFCVSIPYLQNNLDDFIASIPDASMDVSLLCRTRHGRPVELLKFGDTTAEQTVFITSRHHCQEEMATFAMEGMIREITSHPQEFRGLKFYAIPIVDKDGAMEGDQGKRRTPHDHENDYQASPIYPETAAIMRLAETVRPVLFMDLHCPWLRSGANEFAYIVGKPWPHIQNGIDRFSAILETEAPAELPFYAKDNVAFGTSWNKAETYARDGVNPIHWAAERPWKPYAMTFEIPFANCRDITLDENSARLFGQALAISVRRFLLP